MIAIPILAALLLGAPQDPADTAVPVPPPTVLKAPIQLTPEQQEQIRQKQEQLRISREPQRKEAVRINDLAANIHTEADARKLVDSVAEQLTHHRHLFWAAENFRHRVAHAEFESVSDPSGLIPEQRVVDVWNEYAREIDAPEEALISLTDLQTFRAADLHFSQHNWQLDLTQSIWSAPNIYALDAGGNLSDGCRALEALKTIVSMHDQFFRVQFARRAPKQLPTEAGTVKASAFKGRILLANSTSQPVHSAAYRYQQEHGVRAYDQLVRRLFDELFPPE
jgi:hypothetical protein